MGPPCSGKTHLLDRLISEQGLPYMNLAEIIEKGVLGSREDPNGDAARLKRFVAERASPLDAPPASLVLPLVIDYLGRLPYLKDGPGTILLQKCGLAASHDNADGQEVERFQAWVRAGLVPSKFIILECDDAMLLERSRKRQRSLDKNEYHRLRVGKYRQSLSALLPLIEDLDSGVDIRVIDSSRPPDSVIAEALGFIRGALLPRDVFRVMPRRVRQSGGEGHAWCSISVLNAVGTGRGCKIATDAMVQATWRPSGGNVWKLSGCPDDKLVRAIAEMFHLPPAAVAVRSPFPPACGLSTSSAVTLALLRAALDLSTEALLLAAVDVGFAAGVTLTGSWDDLAACARGGAWLTDANKGAINCRVLLPPVAADVSVAIWVPEAGLPKAELKQVGGFEELAPRLRVVEDLVRQSRMWEAIEANSDALAGHYARHGLPCPNDKISTLRGAGALAAGICGMGPAACGIFPSGRLELPKVSGGAWQWHRLTTRLTSVIDADLPPLRVPSRRLRVVEQGSCYERCLRSHLEGEPLSAFMQHVVQASSDLLNWLSSPARPESKLAGGKHFATVDSPCGGWLVCPAPSSSTRGPEPPSPGGSYWAIWVHPEWYTEEWKRRLNGPRDIVQGPDVKGRLPRDLGCDVLVPGSLRKPCGEYLHTLRDAERSVGLSRAVDCLLAAVAGGQLLTLDGRPHPWKCFFEYPPDKYNSSLRFEIRLVRGAEEVSEEGPKPSVLAGIAGRASTSFSLDSLWCHMRCGDDMPGDKSGRMAFDYTVSRRGGGLISELLRVSMLLGSSGMSEEEAGLLPFTAIDLGACNADMQQVLVGAAGASAEGATAFSANSLLVSCLLEQSPPGARAPVTGAGISSTDCADSGTNTHAPTLRRLASTEGSLFLATECCDFYRRHMLPLYQAEPLPQFLADMISVTPIAAHDFRTFDDGSPTYALIDAPLGGWVLCPSPKQMDPNEPVPSKESVLSTLDYVAFWIAPSFWTESWKAEVRRLEAAGPQGPWTARVDRSGVAKPDDPPGSYMHTFRDVDSEEKLATLEALWAGADAFFTRTFGIGCAALRLIEFHEPTELKYGSLHVHFRLADDDASASNVTKLRQQVFNVNRSHSFRAVCALLRRDLQYFSQGKALFTYTSHTGRSLWELMDAGDIPWMRVVLAQPAGSKESHHYLLGIA